MTLQSMGSASPADAEGKRINELAPWFHNIHLPSGHQTAQDHPLGDFPRFKWEQIAGSIPQDLGGWTALDIGCNAGFYSVQLGLRGAKVLGIDHDDHYLRQARWVAERFDLGDAVSFENMGVYDLPRLEERFDLVLFMGVLYHLRYPLLALDLVFEKARKMLVLQTLTMPGDETADAPEDLDIHDRDRMLEASWPKMAFIEKQLAGDDTNWWAPTGSCVEAMVRSTGSRVVDRPGHEIFICEPAPAQPGALRREMRAATGRGRDIKGKEIT